MTALATETPAVPPAPATPSTAEILGGRMEALDGLRGLGLVMVVLGHSFLMLPAWAQLLPDAVVCQPLKMTWIGVDFFFVLSGFLISGILLDSKGGKGYFKSFYARRVLRIFPLNYGALAVVFFILPLFRGPSLNDAWLFSHQAWFWGCLQNWLMAGRGGNIPGGAWVGHFWSLGIEEQFYVFWPLLVLLCSRRGLVAVCSLLIAGSFCVRVWMQSRGMDPGAIYMSTPARLDLLAWGAIVAALARGPGGLPALLRPAKIAFGCGVAVLLAAAVVDRQPSLHTFAMQRYGFSATGFLGAGLMVLLISLPPGTALSKVFCHPVATWMGRRSYATYVIHMFAVHSLRFSVGTRTVLATGSTVLGVLVTGACALAISVVLAEVSAKCLEEPALKLRKHFPIPRPAA